ncbi:MAG: hypothetical protein ACTSRD_13420 [Promethearchaeota archaeon]
MGYNDLTSEQLHTRQTSLILTLGIITFITSIVGTYKYSLIVYWIQTSSPYIDPIHPNIYIWFLIANLIQRIPVLLTWLFLFINILRIFRTSGTKSLKILVYFVGFIFGLSLISVIYFSLALFSLIDAHFFSLLGSLESDFFMLTIANILELLLWLRLRSYIEITPYVKKERKKKVYRGISILIIAVSVSLALKFVFIGDEVQMFGNPYADYSLFYTLIFGCCAVLEGFKSLFYIIGGLTTGIHRRKRNKNKSFNIAQKQ